MKTVLFCSAILALFTTSTIQAADAQGSFAIRNAGMVTCQSFVDEKAKRSATFNLYMGWIDGYISAANQFTADTYDLIPWGNTPFLAALIENHCKKNLDQRFYVAVNRLASAMMDQRLKSKSELVEANHQGKRSYIYKSVLKDLQTYLKDNDFYKGDADGSFGPQTIQALESYQRSKTLTVTGLPDQVTLYNIFRAQAQH